MVKRSSTVVSPTCKQSVLIIWLNQRKFLRENVVKVNFRLNRTVSTIDFASNYTLATVDANKVFVRHEGVIKSRSCLLVVLVLYIVRFIEAWTQRVFVSFKISDFQWLFGSNLKLRIFDDWLLLIFLSGRIFLCFRYSWS